MSEKISGLLDGELPSDELASTLKSLGSEDLAKVERYQLIGALMRNDGTEAALNSARSGLCGRISKQIEQEPRWLLPAPPRSRKADVVASASRSPAFLGGFAIAASIAAIAVFVVAPNWLESPGLSAPPVAQVEQGPARATRSLDMDELGSMLIEHGEFTGSAGINGLLAYAKFVTQGVE